MDTTYGQMQQNTTKKSKTIKKLKQINDKSLSKKQVNIAAYATATTVVALYSNRQEPLQAKKMASKLAALYDVYSQNDIL